MEKKRAKTLAFAALAALLLSAALAHAATYGPDVQKQSSSRILSILKSAGEILARMIFLILKPLVGKVENSLLANPEIYPLHEQDGQLTTNGRIFRDMFIILAPLYGMTVLILGAYMVFMSHSPQGRAQAKMMLDKIIVSMIIVPVAPAIYEILLQTSNIIARSVMSTVLASTGKDTITNAIEGAFAITMQPIWTLFILNVGLGMFITLLILGILLWALIFAIITFWFRYIVVKAFAFLFPLVLFVYLFEWTRHIGAKLLQFTLVWIFTPVISAVFLATGIIMVYSSPARVSGMSGYGYMAGAGAYGGIARGLVSDMLTLILNPLFLTITMCMVWIAPLVMSGVMRVLGGIVSAVALVVPGPWGLALSAVGGMMQGKSVGELATVGIKYAGGKAMDALKKTQAGKKIVAMKQTVGAGVGRAAAAVGGAYGRTRFGKSRLGRGLGGAARLAGRAVKRGLGLSVNPSDVRSPSQPGTQPAKSSSFSDRMKKLAKPGGWDAMRAGASKLGQAGRSVGRNNIVSFSRRTAPRLPGSLSAARQRLRAVAYALPKLDRGRFRSAISGTKAGLSQFKNSMTGEGRENFNRDRRRQKAARRLSHDVKNLRNTGAVTDAQAAKLQAAGLDTNAKILRASDEKLAKALDGDQNAAESIKKAAQSTQVNEHTLKESLGSPDRKRREPPGADLVGNMDVADEEGE